jgi:hypothetical protein
MTSHGEWFRDTKDLKTPGFVETGDDTTHPLTQIDKVPLSMQDEEPRQIDCQRRKEWMNVHLGCEHA